MAIIIIDEKPPPDSGELVRLDLPPDYESSAFRTNTAASTTTSDWPPNSPTNPPPKSSLWRRWLRSPMALSVLFLGVAIIAVAIGLAVHFSVHHNPFPAPEGDGAWPNMNPKDPFGPWSFAVKTFELPVDTQNVAFVSTPSNTNRNMPKYLI